MADKQSSAQVVMELMLHEAAANADDRKIEELQVYLKRGKILINQADVEWGNRTPLHCAAERGVFNSQVCWTTQSEEVVEFTGLMHVFHRLA